MAFQNVHDNTESDLWNRTMVSVKTNDRPFTGGRRASVSRPRRYYRGNGRNRKHSYFWNFPDHHQLNAMDFVALYHAKGMLDYSEGKNNQYRINQDVRKVPGTGSLNALRSLVITLHPYILPGTYNPKTGRGVVNPNAVYNGRRLTTASFVRYSSGESSHSDNMYDSTGNFLALMHNHFHPNDKVYPDSKDKREIKRMNNLRRKAIQEYYKEFHTYVSGFPFDGTNAFKKYYHNNKYIKGVHGAQAKSPLVVTLSSGKDEPFRDSRKYYQDDFTKRDDWFRHSVANDYLHGVRRIPQAMLKKYGRTQNIRSYNGRFTFKYRKCPDKKTLKKLSHDLYRHNQIAKSQIEDHPTRSKIDYQYQYLVKGFYNPERKLFFTLELSPHQYDPMVEFPYWAKKRKDIRVTPKEASEVLKNDPHLKEHLNYHLVNPKDDPHYDKSKAKDDRKYLVKSVVTNQWVVTGTDRIYLMPDWKRAKYYTNAKKHTITAFTGTTGKPDINKYSRSKQIAPGSQTNFGAWFQSGKGRDVLYVTEATIDAYSRYALNHSINKHVSASYFPMEGVMKSDAINEFLHTVGAKKNEFGTAVLCVDNDKAGHRGVEKMLASIHDKEDFVKNHNSTSINPVTQSPQKILIQVPGVYRSPKTGKIRKWIPGDLGRFHLKDENDVLQAVDGSGKYKSIKGKPSIKGLRRFPNMTMNISEYNQMIMDEMLGKMNRDSVLGIDNAKHAKNFMNIYGSYQKSLDKKSNMSGQNKYLGQLKKEFRAMDGVGRTVLNEYMDRQRGHGLSHNSPKDLAHYANHSGDIPVSRDESRTIKDPQHDPQKNIQRHVEDTMNKLRDGSGKSQQLYDLALQSLTRMMPSARKETPSLKRQAILHINGQFYQHIMGMNADRSNYNMYQDNPIHRMEAVESIHSCIGPMLLHDKNIDPAVALEASHKYLAKKGLKPITAKEVLNNDGVSGSRLYSSMRKSQMNYIKKSKDIQKQTAFVSESHGKNSRPITIKSPKAEAGKSVSNKSKAVSSTPKASAFSTSPSFSQSASSASSENKPKSNINSIIQSLNNKSIHKAESSEEKHAKSSAVSPWKQMDVSSMFSFKALYDMDSKGNLYAEGSLVTKDLTSDEVINKDKSQENLAESVGANILRNPSTASSYENEFGKSSLASMKVNFSTTNWVNGMAVASDKALMSWANKSMSAKASVSPEDKSIVAKMSASTASDERKFYGSVTPAQIKYAKNYAIKDFKSYPASNNEDKKKAQLDWHKKYDSKNLMGVMATKMAYDAISNNHSSSTPKSAVPDSAGGSSKPSSSQSVTSESSSLDKTASSRSSQTSRVTSGNEKAVSSKASLNNRIKAFNHSPMNNSLLASLNRDSKFNDLLKKRQSNRSNSASRSRNKLDKKGAENQSNRNKNRSPSSHQSYRMKHGNGEDWE